MLTLHRGGWGGSLLDDHLAPRWVIFRRSVPVRRATTSSIAPRDSPCLGRGSVVSRTSGAAEALHAILVGSRHGAWMGISDVGLDLDEFTLDALRAFLVCWRVDDGVTVRDLWKIAVEGVSNLRQRGYG